MNNLKSKNPHIELELRQQECNNTIEKILYEGNATSIGFSCSFLRLNQLEIANSISSIDRVFYQMLKEKAELSEGERIQVIIRKIRENNENAFIETKNILELLREFLINHSNSINDYCDEIKKALKQENNEKILIILQKIINRNDLVKRTPDEMIRQYNKKPNVKFR